MPRKKTSKRNRSAKGIKKKPSFTKNIKKNSVKLGFPGVPGQPVFITNEGEIKKRLKPLRKIINQEYKKTSPNFETIFQTADEMKNISSQGRLPFVEPEPLNTNSVIHTHENINWIHPNSSMRRNIYNQKIIKKINKKNRKNRKNIPDEFQNKPTRVTWGRNQERSPSPVSMTANTMTPQQTRTWRQFLTEKLGVGKGTKKQKKKNKKAKATGKSKSKTKR